MARAWGWAPQCGREPRHLRARSCRSILHTRSPGSAKLHRGILYDLLNREALKRDELDNSVNDCIDWIRSDMSSCETRRDVLLVSKKTSPLVQKDDMSTRRHVFFRRHVFLLDKTAMSSCSAGRLLLLLSNAECPPVRQEDMSSC